MDYTSLPKTKPTCLAIEVDDSHHTFNQLWTQNGTNSHYDAVITPPSTNTKPSFFPIINALFTLPIIQTNKNKPNTPSLSLFLSLSKKVGCFLIKSYFIFLFLLKLLFTFYETRFSSIWWSECLWTLLLNVFVMCTATAATQF